MSEHAERLQKVAAETFGWAELHPQQLEAMELVMGGRDALAVLPTGAGKSAIYQVPALLLAGPTLVVSPLLALQCDQVVRIGGSAAPSGGRELRTRHHRNPACLGGGQRRERRVLVLVT